MSGSQRRLMEKAELRLAARAALKAFPPGAFAAESLRIKKNVVGSAQFAAAENIFLYISGRYEADTSGIIAASLAAKKMVAAPRCRPGGIMDFYPFTDADSLKPGLLSIPEPTSDLPLQPGVRDLILLPGLLFTPDGARLGQGGGYYDRWLALHPTAFTMGLCLSCQLCEHLPTEPHDMRLDAVICAEKIYYQRKSNGNH